MCRLWCHVCFNHGIFVRLARNGLFNSEEKSRRRKLLSTLFIRWRKPASAPRGRNATFASITRQIIATRVGDNRGNGIVVVGLDGSVSGISKGSSSCMSCGNSGVDSIVATSRITLYTQSNLHTSYE